MEVVTTLQDSHEVIREATLAMLRLPRAQFRSELRRFKPEQRRVLVAARKEQLGG